MLGLQRGTVRIVPYQAQWAVLFAHEKHHITEALGPLALDIQHIGSTAVPGLAAKPIIDMGVAIANRHVVPLCVPHLAALNYTSFGDREQRGDYFFAKGAEECRTHYVHMVEVGSPQWSAYLQLRDYLRTHPAARGAYTNLKQTLATQYAHDRSTYTDRKTPLIHHLLGQARTQPEDSYLG